MKQEYLAHGLEFQPLQVLVTLKTWNNPVFRQKILHIKLTLRQHIRFCTLDSSNGLVKKCFSLMTLYKQPRKSILTQQSLVNKQKISWIGLEVM